MHVLLEACGRLTISWLGEPCFLTEAASCLSSLLSRRATSGEQSRSARVAREEMGESGGALKMVAFWEGMYSFPDASLVVAGRKTSRACCWNSLTPEPELESKSSATVSRS